MKKTDEYFSEVITALTNLDRKIVANIAQEIGQCDINQGKILVIGNGGSTSTASHFSGDLSKTCGFESYCLSDSTYLITAFANDNGYENVFSEQLLRDGYEHDLLVCISGSGNSLNILRAATNAISQGMKVIGLTGFDGGQLKDLCNICLIVPSEHMEVIEDAHLSICHCIVEMLKGD